MRNCRLIVMMLVACSTASLHAQAKLLPKPSGEGVDRAQPFDRKVPDPQVYGGRVYFVWGAQKPKNPAPVVGSKYLPFSRDADHSHTLEWYKQNHPDWVMYQKDRTPVLEYKNNATPIDFTNPAVREFYWNTFVQPNIDAGYPMFAFDNVDLQNGSHRAGHYDAQGKWVAQYTGEKVDDAYALAVLEWIQYLTTRLHAAGIGVAANMTYPLGKPQLLPAMRKLVEMVDVWGDEQGFTQHSDSEISDEKWEQKFGFVRSVEKDHMHWAINELTTPHLSDATQKQIDWAVANYYLYRESGSMVTLTGAQEYGVYLDTPAMQVNLGRPAGDPVKDKGGAWKRVYSKGLTVVNPSSKASETASLPPGRWVDSHGKEYSGEIRLETVSGVLLRAK